MTLTLLRSRLGEFQTRSAAGRCFSNANAMNNDPNRTATITICCRLPQGSTALSIDDWTRPAGSANVAVTWVVGPDELSQVASLGPAGIRPENLAMEIPQEWLAAEMGPSALRRNLAEVRRSFRWLDGLVLAPSISSGAASNLRAEVIGELGFRVVAVPELGSRPHRRSRRPAPNGWECRNPAWGLWEVGFASQKRRGLLRNWLPLITGPKVEPGGLAVLRSGATSAKGKREARERFERLVHWAARQVAFGRPAARVLTLSQLGALLSSGATGSGQRSILAA